MFLVRTPYVEVGTVSILCLNVNLETRITRGVWVIAHRTDSDMVRPGATMKGAMAQSSHPMFLPAILCELCVTDLYLCLEKWNEQIKFIAASAKLENMTFSYETSHEWKDYDGMTRALNGICTTVALIDTSLLTVQECIGIILETIDYLDVHSNDKFKQILRQNSELLKGHLKYYEARCRELLRRTAQFDKRSRTLSSAVSIYLTSLTKCSS